jgi:8-oxo-dGTP pyrophosphatase MutT (NUDIX family)
MTRIVKGDRIGRNGVLRVGCSAVIFDVSREKVLLTRREDNNQWCLPSGGMEPGESAIEACVREVLEETGLSVVVKRLVGIYTSPHQLIEYRDGNKVQLVALCFEADMVGGSLGLSDETTAYGYFSQSEIKDLDMLSSHIQRIDDAFSGLAFPFLR